MSTEPEVKITLPDDLKQKKNFQEKIHKNEVVQITRKKEYTTEELIRALLRESAEENARLTILRDKTQLESEDEVSLTKRKVDILKQIGDLTLNLEKTLASREIDLKSKSFRILMNLLLRKFDEAMDNSKMPSELKETIFNEFAALTEQLEKDYKRELKSEGK